MGNRALLLTTATVVFALAPPVSAQLDLPRVSPKATLSQTVGLTDVTITSCRPSV